MFDVPKKILRAEDGIPVAVQIEYDDWKRIEEKLQTLPPDSAEDNDETAFERVLNASQGTWTAGDGLWSTSVASEPNGIDRTIPPTPTHNWWVRDFDADQHPFVVVPYTL